MCWMHCCHLMHPPLSGRSFLSSRYSIFQNPHSPCQSPHATSMLSGAQAGINAHGVCLLLADCRICFIYILHAANCYSMFGGRRLLNTSRLNTGALSTNLLQPSSCLCNAELAFHTLLFTHSELTLSSCLSLSCSHKYLPVF